MSTHDALFGGVVEHEQRLVVTGGIKSGGRHDLHGGVHEHLTLMCYQIISHAA